MKIFSKKRSRDLIHVKNMILVAAADSIIKKEEMIIISRIFKSMKISHEAFEQALLVLGLEGKIRVSGDTIRLTSDAITNIEVIPAKNDKDKKGYLLDYVFIMMSDGSINEIEKQLCYAIARKMGLQDYDIDLIIETTRQILHLEVNNR